MAATKTSPTRKRKKKMKPKACPSCGGMECFERPRYFPGQLLTNADLEADQRYFIEKNKLHNRHLVGSGVVCGLAVRCGNCDGVVVVEPGYAIDCCGNDIVLCDPAEFDAIAYLEACRRQEDPDCYSKIRAPQSPCDDEPQEYCLILSYTETLTKPLTAFTRQNGCTPNRCEPSRICEGYRLDLVKKQELEDRLSPPSLWEKIRDCANEILPRWKALSAEAEAAEDQLDQSQSLSLYHSVVFALVCKIKQVILDLYKRHPKVRCTLLDEVREIEISYPALPDPIDTFTREEYLRQARETIFRMGFFLIQFYIDCLCDALLVPCTECEEDGVLLACLTICKGRIQKICNIVRKPVLSGPALQYWLQPLYDALGNFGEALCCNFEINLPEEDRRSEGVGAVFDRSIALLDLARDIPTTAISNLSNFVLNQVSQPTATIAAADVYNQPVSQILTDLESRNITVVQTQAQTTAEAYDLRVLASMTWEPIPEGSQVEIVTSPEGLVTSIRRLGDSQS